MWQHGLRDQQRPERVDTIDQIEIIRIDLVGLEVGRAGDPGTVDHRVKLAVVLYYGLPYRALGACIGNLDSEGLGLATCSDNFACSIRSAVCITVEADDAGSTNRQ